MDVPLNLDFVQKLSDPPWSSLEHVAGNPSAMLVHDGGNSAAIHDVSKSHGRRAVAIAGLRPISREVNGRVLKFCNSSHESHAENG